MLPNSLLRAALGLLIRITSRSGDTYVGYLVTTDTHMNVVLKDVIFTSADATEFYQYDEILIRGTSVRYFVFDNSVLEKMKNTEAQDSGNQQNFQKGYARGGNRGGSRGGNRGAGRGANRGSSRGGSRPNNSYRPQA